MPPTLETLGVFLARLAPGFFLGALLVYLARREPFVRIVLYLALFVLLRDTMTPLRLWSFGADGFFWIRLSNDPTFLILSGVTSLGLCLGLYHFDRENRSLVHWTRGSVLVGLVAGLVGAVLVVAPLAYRYQSVPIDWRGGPVASGLLPAILVFALLGNLLEEILFRGYLAGWLAQRTTRIRAGLLSGVVFAFCHIFLATTVTNAGYPLLVFTLWEGLLAGLVWAKWGVLASTMTHGGAIFLLSSGLF